MQRFKELGAPSRSTNVTVSRHTTEQRQIDRMEKIKQPRARQQRTIGLQLRARVRSRQQVFELRLVFLTPSAKKTGVRQHRPDGRLRGRTSFASFSRTAPGTSSLLKTLVGGIEADRGEGLEGGAGSGLATSRRIRGHSNATRRRSGRCGLSSPLHRGQGNLDADEVSPVAPYGAVWRRGDRLPSGAERIPTAVATC